MMVYIYGGVILLILMTFLWLVSLSLRDASIVDIFWGMGFVILAWFYFTQTPGGYLGRKWLLSSLTTLWGLRLALHIFFRNLGKGEDFRYRRWREQAGATWWWKSYLQVFLLQGLLLWLVSAPLLAAQLSRTPARLNVWDYAGLVLWGIGFYFEAAGDWQLMRFKANPVNRDRLLTDGVWRFTRHPNYFGDAAQWWGFFLIAAAGGAWWSLYSPLLMTILLLRVSGVVMLERGLTESKPGYREYVESTSAFIPWVPKQKK